MIGRKSRELKRGASKRRHMNVLGSVIASAALSVTGLALMAPVASAEPVLPTITTEAASGASYQKVTLNGTVNPNGLTTTYHFEYGETTSYGTKIPVPDASAGNGTSNVKVSETIRGLKLGPTYHFRLVATNGGGTAYGEDRTFTTITGTSWAVAGQEPKSSVTVKSKGAIKIQEEKIPALFGGGHFTVECAESTGEGTVGASGGGEQKKLSWTGCKVVNSTNTTCPTGTEIVGGVQAHDLPWRTTLVSSEGAVREQVAEDGKGKPALTYICKNISNEVFGFTSFATKTVAGGVDEAFDSHSGTLKSTISMTPVVEGTQLIESPSSGMLTAGLRMGEWLVGGKAPAGAVAVGSKGTFKIELQPTAFDGGGYVEIECSETGEGAVGPGGEGEATGVKLTGCKAVASTNSLCAAGATTPVTALDLPWRTVLVTTESGTQELVIENGKGRPGYRVECGSLGTLQGTENTSMSVKGVAGGVEQTLEVQQGGWTGEVNRVRLSAGLLLESPLSGALTFKEG